MPGPAIGVMNPTGLTGKGSLVNKLPSGTWCTSETHLTSQGIQRFKQELVWCNSSFKLCHSIPAPPKNDSSRTVGGKHTGVGLISSFPTRTVSHMWKDTDFATARCHVGSSFFNTQWVHFGTVYGYAENAYKSEVQQATDQLLQGLTDRIVYGCNGPRVLAGDWNQEKSNMPQTEIWERLGWIEAQEFAKQKWQYVPVASCKRTTIKDFLYLSPEIQPFVKDVKVDWSFFPDHGVLYVELEELGPPQKIPMWRKPASINFEKVSLDDLQNGVNVELDWVNKPDESYRTVFQQFERRVDDAKAKKNLDRLTPVQLGRGQTTEVRLSSKPLAPPKPSRHGDVQIGIPALSLTHTRWVRQVRRLEHYARCARSEHDSLDKTLHKCSLWGKILRAPGFLGSFAEWWETISHSGQHAPSILPVKPPDDLVAHGVFLEFLREFRALEESLKSQRIQVAVERRKADSMIVFQDVKEETSEPVQTLMAVEKVQIQSIETKHEHQVISIEPNLTNGILAISNHGHEWQPSFDEHGRMILNKNIPLEVGQTLECKHMIGEVQKMFEHFQKEWSQRWSRHDSINDERWKHIIEFAKHAIPPRKFSFEPINLTMWRKVLKSKKRKTAKGPDGISREDLMMLPDDLTQRILDMISAVEQGHAWPTQTMVGIVSSLAKIPNPQFVNHFRPITVLTLCYRVWSSIRARQALRCLAEIAPFSLMGNMPGKSPKLMWYHLQGLIEHAQATNQTIAGGVIDIVKCFNFLPRTPLLEIAAHVGLSEAILVPWKSALRQIQRRFSIRGGVSSPLGSSTGFPEGCPLSVVAMGVANLACEYWMKYRFPSVQTWSYVDNLETVCAEAEEAVTSLEKLGEFCQLLDLQIDHDKSFCWSNEALGRKSIRESQLKISYFGRDLGGHMNYTNWHTNGSITKKIEALEGFWKRLSRSCSPQFQKERAIMASAWPKVFYSISIAPIGPVHFGKLRTHVQCALGLKKYGANPELQCACLCPIKCDPEYYALWETIMAFRMYAIPELASAVLDVGVGGKKTTPGPFSSLLKSIHKIGWRWENPFVVDAYGITIDIVHCPIAELKERLSLAWQERTCRLVEDIRKTMTGLHKSDVALTMKRFHEAIPDRQGLLRCALNGTFYTNDVLVHTNKVENSLCSFCSQQDSISHRLFHCEYFSPERAKLSTNTLQTVQQEPDSFRLHGWIPRSPDAMLLKQMLCNITQNTTRCFISDEWIELPEVLDIFTDGSCLHPQFKDQRIATWGVVCWCGERFWPVSRGVVPGWHQTSLRGEILGITSALAFATRFQRRCRLWVDNLAVYKFVCDCLNQQHDFSKNKDSDFWHHAYLQFQQAVKLGVSVHKVVSHIDANNGDTEVEQWAFLGNAAADKVAEEARLDLPPELWVVWERLVAHQQLYQQVGQEWQNFLMDVGAKAVVSKQQIRNDPVPQSDDVALTIDENLQKLCDTSFEELPIHFQRECTPILLQWMKNLVAEGGTVRWLSWHQLLIDFQFSTNIPGPKNASGRRWFHMTKEEAIKGYDYPKQALWFAHYWQNMSKANGAPIGYEKRRPYSFTIAFWTTCVRVPITDERLQRIETFYKTHGTTLPFRSIHKHMKDIPVASHD